MNQEILMARQSIFDTNLNTVAYELLYRSDSNNAANFDFSGSSATIDVLLNTYTSVYHNQSLKCMPAFINMTYDLIVNDTLPALPNNKIVLEILEDVEVTDQLILSVKKLKEKGYTIALDDFIFDEKFIPLINLAKIIKIDVLDMSFDEVTLQVKKLKKFKGTLLAEKIETHEMFEHCKNLGFKLFQGYFLSKPKIVKGAKASSSQMHLLTIIKESQNPDINPAHLEKLILKEPSFTFKLLRIVNSSANNLVREISSVKDAINLLGISEVRKWALIIMMQSSTSKPNELSRQLLIRGRMCEKIAKASGINDTAGYMIAGMMSGLDALLDIEMDSLLTQVPLTQEIKSAITEGSGLMGEVIHNTIRFSDGQWQSMVPENVNQNMYNDAYKDSLHWVTDLMESIQD